MRPPIRWIAPALALAAAGCGGRSEPQGASDSSEAYAATPRSSAVAAPKPACDPGNGGITLPRGFCAVVVADNVGRARHVAVAPNGDVYVALDRGRGGAQTGILALRDTDGDGKPDVRERFGDAAGTGIRVHGGWLYFAPDDRVIRYRLQPGRLVPDGAPQTLVTGLPTGGHTSKTLAFDRQGGMFVTIGSRSNSCQVADRQNESPGRDPCPELATRAGIWRFDANRPGQTEADGVRWATGIRNGMAKDVNPADGKLYAISHGRDQLSGWPRYFDDRDNAEKPAEELFRVERGSDFGWPYCYYDPEIHRKVLAPEYGGNGKEVGRCAAKGDPVLAFPAHWAPNDLVFYNGSQFPARYRGGAFIAFHGSWNRAPLPQAGFRVVFTPFRGGTPTGQYETFAGDFAGSNPGAGPNQHRPTGLAVAPDGSLYVTDDAGGRIWRIYYTGR